MLLLCSALENSRLIIVIFHNFLSFIMKGKIGLSVAKNNVFPSFVWFRCNSLRAYQAQCSLSPDISRTHNVSQTPRVEKMPLSVGVWA